MPKTVLIVEDNPAHAKMITDILKAKGFDAEHAVNGAEVQERIRNHRPDLILMDIQLPDISGVDVTKALKADDDFKDIPVVAITAFVSKQNQDDMRGAGVVDILTKPFSIPELLETVAGYLGTPE